jgi:hypothetical protein
MELVAQRDPFRKLPNKPLYILYNAALALLANKDYVTK